MQTFLGVAWENIFIGLMGGAVVSLMGILHTYIKNKIIEKRFPIYGEYITKFEDIENKQKLETTALAILKQHGKKIKGETWLDNNRKWILEGQLSDNGNLSGVYYAEDPVDTGIGNFFLKINTNREMNGLWSGYDYINQNIESGKYTFRPILSNYKIKNLCKEHIVKVIKIAEEELGENYFDYEELIKVIQKPDEYICKVAISDIGKIYGFGFCKIASFEELKKYLKLENEDVPNYILHSESIGIIKTVVTDKRYKRQGVGYNLVQECHRLLVDMKVDAVASVAWKKGNIINIGRILEKMEFKNYKEIEDYWLEDSKENKFECSNCGWPCHCSAVMFFKPL